MMMVAGFLLLLKSEYVLNYKMWEQDKILFHDLDQTLQQKQSLILPYKLDNRPNLMSVASD